MGSVGGGVWVGSEWEMWVGGVGGCMVSGGVAGCMVGGGGVGRW